MSEEEKNLTPAASAEEAKNPVKEPEEEEKHESG